MEQEIEEPIQSSEIMYIYHVLINAGSAHMIQTIQNYGRGMWSLPHFIMVNKITIKLLLR